MNCCTIHLVSCSVLHGCADWLVMARYAQNYVGERRSCSVGFKLTPTERAKLEAAAEARGLPLSDHLRSLCIKNSPTVAAATRRNPQAGAILGELGALGNNLNQLTKQAESQRVFPALSVLRTATDAIKNAMARVIAL